MSDGHTPAEGELGAPPTGGSARSRNVRQATGYTDAAARVFVGAFTAAFGTQTLDAAIGTAAAATKAFCALLDEPA